MPAKFVEFFRPRAIRLAPILLLSFLVWGHSLCAAQSSGGGPSGGDAPTMQNHDQSATVSAQVSSASPLSAERRAEAIAYARADHQFFFLQLVWTVAVLLVVLRVGVARRFRNWAESLAQDRFMQALIFAPALLLALDALLLPVDAASHWLQRDFGQSVQGWGPWLVSQAKSDVLAAAAGALLVWLVSTIMRRSPRHWWFYGWLGVLPVLIFSAFVNPVLIDPLFYHFTPLADSQPELVRQLERVVARSGQRIPENRIFLMDASRNIKDVNAYVTGFGASARVVVWDTTVARMTTPEILCMFGHELGHYVLRHRIQSLAFSMAVLLLVCWIGFHSFRWAVRRFGDAWGLRGVDDWASLPLALLLLYLLNTASAPVQNAFQRHLEHEADQYGLEVVHGVVPNSAEVAAEGFKLLGEIDLSDPSPSTLVKIWFYDHPPLGERIQFAYDYNPWAAGKAPRFVK